MNLGMEHNPGLTEEQDVSHYIERDLLKHKEPPYKIIRDEIVGRHMVAARDIKVGENIFKEAPLTFGPSENTKPICLGCYKSVSMTSPRCSACGFPMCSKDCPDIKFHKKFECAAFVKHNFKVNADLIDYESRTEPVYEAISAIRTFLVQKLNPEIWPLIWMQMSHLSQRNSSEFWKKKTEKTLKTMTNMIGLDPQDIPKVEAILGIHLVNDFEIGLQDRTIELEDCSRDSIRGLFGLASMPNHDCLANTTHTFSSVDEGCVMTVKAIQNIKKGDDITHSYAESLDPILTRQTILTLGKFFACKCPRCSDPTELGTYSSALKCPKCHQGNVIPTQPQNTDAKWACQSCHKSIHPDKVSKVTKAVKDAGDKLDLEPKIEEYETFLKKYSTVLHPNHVIFIDKKYHLAKMYGRMPGFEASDLSDEQLKRKRQLCLDVLTILEKIMPGQSRKKGMMKYELHLPLVMLTNKNLQRGPACGVDPEVLKKDLILGLESLKEGLTILDQEPEGSFEKKIVHGSKESVSQLEDFVKVVCSSL